MADDEVFNALRVRRRLEDIARTIADARASGDIYAGLDAVEQGLLGVMDEVAELAHALVSHQVMVANARHRRSWRGRLALLLRPHEA